MRFLLIASLLVLQADFSDAEQVHDEEHRADGQHDVHKPGAPWDPFKGTVRVDYPFPHYEKPKRAAKIPKTETPKRKKARHSHLKALVDKKKHHAVWTPKKATQKKSHLHKMMQKTTKQETTKPQKMTVQKNEHAHHHKDTFQHKQHKQHKGHKPNHHPKGSSLLEEPAADTSKTPAVEPAVDEQYNRAWAEVTQWMIENGAKVKPGLVGKPTNHGGNNIRGIITDVDLKDGNFLEVPAKVWINIDSFPTLASVDLSKIEACHDVSHTEATRMLIAAGIAQEVQLKDKSFYWPYLKNLPSLVEYKSFFPRLADSLDSQSPVAQFDGLPFVNHIKAMQKKDLRINKCFQGWQRQSSGDASGIGRITWDEFNVALIWFRTRSYGGTAQGQDGKDGPSLIPGADLMNTEARLNTFWHVTGKNWQKDSAFIVWPQGGLKSGTELVDSYCPECDNSVFLASWGVYLEDNQHHVQAPSIGCDQFAKQVSKAVEDTLDTSSEHLVELLKHKWKAPRCKSSVMQDTANQGPIRCSLARLSWETCPQSFNPSSQPQGQGKAQVQVAHAAEADTVLVHFQHPHSKLDDDTFVNLIDASSRHAVAWQLHSRTLETRRIEKKRLVRREAKTA